MADCGVSLSEAEASIAAPFTSQKADISCMIDLLRRNKN
jgi:cation-transporting ATPase 13A3/4/5